MADRKSIIMQAMLLVEEQDYTAAGMPSVEALNLAIKTMDLDDQQKPVTSSERDVVWLELTEQPNPDDNPPPEEAAAEPEIGALKSITITEAQSDPVTVYVHGRGSFSLRVGIPGFVPQEGLDALRNSDVKFKENDQ